MALDNPTRPIGITQIMEPITVVEHAGHQIEIRYDPFAQSPRENDNLGTIWLHERINYKADDNSFSDIDNFLTQNLEVEDRDRFERVMDQVWSKYPDYYNSREDQKAADDLEQKIRERYMAILERSYIILPVYIYEHSGVMFKTSPFSCPWDSGQAGFIMVSRAQVRKEYGWKVITKARQAKIEEYLAGEIKEYSSYANGETYGYKIFPAVGTDEEGETTYSMDSTDDCWGFYGHDYCLEAAKEAAELETSHKAA